MDNKRRGAPVSLIEIAREAAVSPATVSRAFNRPALVQAKTLERIMAVAEQHGFRPNRLGSSLRSGSTRTLGLVLPTLSNPVFADCFEGAEMRARESGYSVMMTVTHYDPALEAAAVHRLIDHQLDGVILTVANPRQSAVLKALKTRGVSYVLAYNESSTHPCSAVDNHAAACDMVEHLAQLGHRRIAFISGPLSMSDRAATRLTGSRSRARSLGLSLIRHYIMPSHTQTDNGILAQMLDGAARPSALFCSNDLLATAVIVSLRELGYSVPDDISVAGFDGIRYGTVMSPSLTTIEAAGYEIGKTACHLLLEQIEHQQSRSQQVPHTLITGASAARLNLPLTHRP
ncbi:LacI family DNA-binding transcriptional regulator [Pollutimonas harenae]|uniref:LacI family DNA-binding transcriptional regulator n=1 Tax=Pollutimonas harenae TaxID=657015 RepID=A0A853GZK1_9BURK|nr:LacI family DNA-binding transcriptional regulator [Pollutimonas harenae]NYT84475.1 LacI family DNA-binding transcriptional regulator [Pollutimonas harenae]TEA73648.1 LacI family DNA-binding transcriptional regulator [Pollutimonas harenae]